MCPRGQGHSRGLHLSKSCYNVFWLSIFWGAGVAVLDGFASGVSQTFHMRFCNHSHYYKCNVNVILSDNVAIAFMKKN